MTTISADSVHPGLRPDSRLTPETIASYEASGQWIPETLSDQLTRAAAASPDLVAAVQYVGDPSVRSAVTYAELDALADRLGAGLMAQGVGVGDSVVVMLPNSIDFAALIFAINRIGAVYTGIPVAYGNHEVGHIVATMRPKVVVCEAEYASSRPVDVVRASLGDLDPVVFVRGGSGALQGSERPFGELASDEPVTFPVVDPRTVCHVGFTSGTTGAPKGVLNTNQTLLAVLSNWVDYFGRENLGEHVVNALMSPVGHHSGFLWGVVLTARLGGTAVHLDKWSPRRGAELIRNEGATIYYGAPTFLQDLLTTDLAGDPACRLKVAIVTGSPVPRSLPARGHEAFGAWIGSAWGMTEIGIGISCRPGMSEAEMASDGRQVTGVEARVVDAVGVVVTAGVTGRLQVRSAGLFLGYLGLPEKTAEEIDLEGWFDTGDNARIDEAGLVYLDGRSKDIIIRGGENIPVVAVESVLYTHPRLVDVAVIGLPDERLGERACAVVVHDGSDVPPTLAELNAYLVDNGVSKHFLPERLVVMDELPKTPSGKIRKVELRTMATASS
ncbi:MAG: AMP-binding protein [Aeromicrobium sp.]|uniref:AMP-binding protein n=1 Tax=Aeromicrobium sp. TaxID=1871063 RepID=UPI0026286358|nr:AMP-binding protein [Aeromicrobium sp.]MDF1704921.1 AMP-binding protein [Aeromicrobium sp.]